MAKKYVEYHEGPYHIRVLERGKRHSVRVRMPADADHPMRWYTPSEIVEGSKADAIIRCKDIEYAILHAAEIAAQKAEEERLAAEEAARRVTLARFIEENWTRYRTDCRDQGDLSQLTIDREQVELERIKSSCIGGMPLPDITVLDIEHAYADIVRAGASQDGKHKAHMKLKQVLNRARVEGYIATNPCDSMDKSNTPKRKKVAAKKKADRRITVEQAVELADRLLEEEQTGFTVATWLALATGMRRGECLGLTWDDVELANDLSSGTIHVRAQYGIQHERIEPKTDDSERDVPIGATTARYLANWRKTQQRQFKRGVRHRVKGVRNKRGKATSPKEWTTGTPVCTNDEGRAIEPNNFSRWRRGFFVKCGLGHWEHEEKYVDKNGVTRTRHSGYVGPEFHSLRRIQATMLIADGTDIKTVQKRLGHRDVLTTLSLYAEAVSANEVAAGFNVEDILGIEGRASYRVEKKHALNGATMLDVYQRYLDLVKLPSRSSQTAEFPEM